MDGCILCHFSDRLKISAHWRHRNHRNGVSEYDFEPTFKSLFKRALRARRDCLRWGCFDACILFCCGWGGIDNMKLSLSADVSTSLTEIDSDKIPKKTVGNADDSGDSDVDEDEWNEAMEIEMAEAAVADCDGLSI